MGLFDWSLSYPVELGDDATLDVDVDLGPVGKGQDVATGDELREHGRVRDAVAGRSSHHRDVRPVARPVRVPVIVQVIVIVIVIVLVIVLVGLRFALRPVGDLGALPGGG
jgi:hypothetical protein